MMTLNDQYCTPKKQKAAPNGSRSVIEKQRRQQMKALYSRLASHLPLKPQEKLPLLLPLPALLDRSLGYVKQLKETVERLKAMKEELKEDLEVAAVEVNEKGSGIVEVSLVTGLNKGFILAELLTVLDEEGTRVLRANYSRLRDTIVYSITSQALAPARIGIDTSRLIQRLKTLSGVSGPFVLPASGLQGNNSSSSP